MMRALLPPTLALHVAVLLFGFAGLFGKWLALPAVWIVLGRTAFAAGTLLLVLGVAGGWRTPSTRLLANGLLLAAHWVTFFEAIRVASVAIGLLGFASFPVFVLLIERLHSGERLTRRRLAIGGLVTCGLALLVPEYSFASRALQGLLWGLASGLTFALLTVANRVAAARYPAIAVAFWQNLVAAACLLPVIWLVPASPTREELALLAVLGVLCTALAHTLFIRSLTQLSAHTASVVAALEPVYGIALAMLLLAEIPPPRTLVGGALVIAASLLATTARERR